MSESLRSLISKEQLWANRSGCSWQMSNRERFLVCFINVFWFKNKERFAHSLFLMTDMSKSFRWLTKHERCEQTAQVAHQNEQPWANRSSLTPKMSEWANRSFFWVNLSFVNFFAKNKRFAQKTNELIPSYGILSPRQSVCLVSRDTLTLTISLAKPNQSI